MNNQLQKIYGVRTNTDLTEGRGREYFKYVTNNRTTAERLAKGAYVQGTDASVVELKTVDVDGDAYIRVSPLLTMPSADDIEKEMKRKAQAERDLQRERVLQKAADLGLTDDEIALLKEKE